MEIKTFLEILRRRIWIIIITGLVTILVSIVGTLMIEPSYKSEATLRLETVTSGGLSSVRVEVGLADRLMNTYATLARSDPIIDQTVNGLNLDYKPEIDVDIVPNTELLKIQAVDRNGENAARVANEIAILLVEDSIKANKGDGLSTVEIIATRIEQAEQDVEASRIEYENLVIESPENTAQIDQAQRTLITKQSYLNSLNLEHVKALAQEAQQKVVLSIVDPADVPNRPASPNFIINVFLGTLIGAAGGLVLAFLFENLDTTLYSMEQIEESAELSALGYIPFVKKQERFAMDSHAPQAEAFRHLRTNILSLTQKELPQTLLITSAESGEGKSTVVSNLAVSIAKAGRKVVVVDGDMRIPSLHKFFRLPNEQGLSDILLYSTPLSEVVQHSEIEDVDVISGGPVPANPAELMGVTRMESLLSELKQIYDVIVFDTPPLLSVTDAAVLMPKVDNILLVVAQKLSRQETVHSLRRQLTNINIEPIGIVVNRASTKNGYQYYNKYSKYGLNANNHH